MYLKCLGDSGPLKDVNYCWKYNAGYMQVRRLVIMGDCCMVEFR